MVSTNTRSRAKNKLSNASLVLRRSGITPGYSVVARVTLNKDVDDDTQLKVIDANNLESDILLRNELDNYEKSISVSSRSRTS